MEEKTIWVHIIHYFWMNENGEIYDRIWTSKDFQRSKQFFEIRKDICSLLDTSSSPLY